MREDNTAPTCAITAPESGASFQEGELVTITATVADDQSSAEELAVFWESDLDGELFGGFPLSDGTTTVETDALSLGTHTIALTVSDDSGSSWAVCNDEVLLTIGDPPVIVLEAPTDGELFDEGAEVTFTATVSDATDSPNRLALAWTSDIDGVLNEDPADGSGTAEFTTTTLSPGAHVVTLQATDSDGFYAEESLGLTLNGLPTAPSVSISPDPATTDDDLVAVIDADSVDPEGDTVSYSYAWSVDGVGYPGGDTDTVPAGDTRSGDTWTVEVTPSDPTSDGPAGTASIAIDNSPPELGAVTLTPDPAYAGDTFTCTPDTATDADGDSVTYQTSWTVDGSGISPSSSTLSDDWWAKNQEVSCTVTPWDARDAGTPVTSNAVVVSNSLPSLDSASISPETAAIDDTLTCAWSGFDDADGDSDQSTVSWTIDGTEVGTGATLTAVFGPGDTVVCTVTPDDGQDTGTAVSDSVVVDNTPPELAEVLLDPDPAYEADTLTCTPGTTSDVDGHTVTTSLTWSVSGSDPAVTDWTLTGDHFDKGDTVSCTVTPNDGTDDGDPVTSNEVAVWNTPPILADAILSPDPAYAGDTFTCTAGDTSDDDGDAVSVAYAWSVDGVDPGVTDDTLDDSHWTRHQEVICWITPSDGTDDGASVSSNAITVVNSPPSIDSVSITPESPEVSDTLSCAYSGFADADGDTDLSTYAWDVNGTSAGTGTTLSGAFGAGDLVTCTVTPDDGADTGTPVSDSVIAANTPPELADATLTPTTAYEGDTFTCTPGATSDADGHTVTTSITWDVSGADPGVTGDELTSDHFDRDDTVTCTVTPNDGGDDGDPVDSNTVTVSNTPPELASVSLDPDPAAEGDTLTCTPDTATDADSDSVSVALAWTVNGSSLSHSEDTLDDSNWGRDDEVVCTATPDDGTDSGTAVSSNAVVIANAAPSIASVTISPSAPEVSDTLSCTYSGFSDADGDSDASTFEWTISGVTVGTSSTLSSGFASGDLVTCTVTPSDGTDDGTALSDSVAVDNSAPVLDSVTLGPDPAYADDTLTCTPGTATDADGHTVTYSYAWVVNGSDVGASDSTLDSGYFGKDDDVICVVTPTDGADDGDPVDSNTLVISNTAPVITSVTLAPDPAYEGDTLTCSVDSSSDLDGDGISYSYAWTVDGVDTGVSNFSLGSSDFDKDQVVVCTVTPSDGTDSGSAIDSNALTISNSAPTIGGVEITPSQDPGVDETLTCAAVGFDDPDGDSDQSTFSWTISGSEVGTSATLSGVFAAGDTVTCTLTPSDGTDTGTADSASVQIENSPPVLDSVSLTPTTAFEGDTFTCTPGSASDADGHSITYSYQWNVSGSDPGITSDELGPDYFGSNDQVVCTVTPNDGFDDGASVASNTVTVGNTAPVLDSVELSPDPGYEADTLTCTPGTATDVDGDSISYAYAWEVNGSAIADTGSALTGVSFDKGDTVMCTVTPYDYAGNGTAVDSNVVTIENTPPTLSSVQIEPSSPGLDDTLTCSSSGFSDDDGDTDSSTTSWTISGTEVGTSATLSGVFVKGDEVTCTITPSDGTDTGTAVSASVTVANTPPELDTATLSPDPAYEGETLTCTEGTGTDADGDTVTFTYSWLVDSSDPGVSTSELSSDDWGRGDSVVCIVTPEDGADSGDPVQSNAVVIGNTAPTLTSVTLSPDPGFEGDTLDCSPDDGADVDSDSVSYLYDWTVAGLPVTETSSGLSSTEFAKGDEVFCTATPTDGTDTGPAVDSNTVSIGNTAPTVDGVQIDIRAPKVGDTLTCAYSGYSDADGDTDQSTYAWDIAGTTVGTSATLSGVFSTGDQVTCTVTPSDGEDTGTAVSDTVQVENTAPVLDSVSLTPTSAYEGDTLTCTPGTATDDDGDSIAYSYEWRVGTGDPGVTGNQLDSSYWDRGDQVTCHVTPDDGVDLGDTVLSNTVTILNTVPEITSISLSTSAPTTNENLSVTVSTSDVDGDGVSLSYQWYVDSSPTGTDSSTLSGASYFDKGQTITVEVTPSDSSDTGTSDTSSTATAVNTPPGAPEISVLPDNSEAGDQDIVCAVDLDSADDDNDSVTYTFSWVTEGQVYPDDFTGATGPTSTTDTNDTIPAADTSLGVQWECTVLPNDGEDDGDTATGVARVVNYTNVGNDSAFSSSSSYSANELRGAWLTVSNQATLHRLAIVTPATSGNVKLALYTDSGGPDQLVVGSDSAALNGGAVEIDVGATPITAGTYWLMIVYDQTTDAYVDTSSSKSSAYQSMTFSDSFKPNFGIYSTSTGEDFSVYLVVEEL